MSIYAHERDQDGAIKVPDEEATPTAGAESLERDLRDLDIVAGIMHMTAEARAEAAAKIKAKWAAKGESNG